MAIYLHQGRKKIPLNHVRKQRRSICASGHSQEHVHSLVSYSHCVIPSVDIFIGRKPLALTAASAADDCVQDTYEIGEDCIDLVESSHNAYDVGTRVGISLG